MKSMDDFIGAEIKGAYEELRKTKRMNMTKPDMKSIELMGDDATLTLTEAARVLGISRQGLMHRAHRGQIPAVKVCGTWYVKGSAIKAQIKTNGK